jgi:hypothetical protein
MPFTAAKLGAIHASVIVVARGGGGRFLKAGAFRLRQCLACGNEADFHCLRLDDLARDMAFDQFAVRKGSSASPIDPRRLRMPSRPRV